MFLLVGSHQKLPWQSPPRVYRIGAEPNRIRPAFPFARPPPFPGFAVESSRRICSPLPERGAAHDLMDGLTLRTLFVLLRAFRVANLGISGLDDSEYDPTSLRIRDESAFHGVNRDLLEVIHCKIERIRCRLEF